MNTPLFDSQDEEKRELLSQYLLKVLEVNKSINLTRIDGYEEGMLLHIEDSLTALPEMNSAPDGNYADIGSGGGFPGVPLSICTCRKTTLVDSRAKKMASVEKVLIEMGLNETISTYSGRAELLARKRRNEFAVITARALSKISVLMELSNPLLKRNGHLICYKAHVEDDEFAHARELEERLRMKLVSDRSFRLNEEYERRILVFEKTGEAKVKLPRMEGAAQKQPL